MPNYMQVKHFLELFYIPALQGFLRSPKYITIRIKFLNKLLKYIWEVL